MAKTRRDKKGFVLKKGEYQRSEDGMYAYAYQDVIGKRKVIYAKSLKELREKEAELSRDQYDGIDSYVKGTATVDYMFDRYISTKSNLRKTTKSGYIYLYDRYVRGGFGKRIIGEIHYSDIVKFYMHLMDERGLKVNTVDNVHTILHPVFGMAVRDDIIRKNPTDGVMAELKRKHGKNKGVRHALLKKEQDAFLAYVADNPVYDHWLPMMMFLFGTGARIGEAIGIRWEDILLDDRVISINHSVVYAMDYAGGGGCAFMVHEPKTEKGMRTIPMVDELHDILKDEYERQREEGFCELELDGMKGFVFANRFDNLHKPQMVNSAIERIRNSYNAEEEVKAAKENREAVIIPHFSCHHIRHTFCTRLCETETNIKAIQEIMGHANIETTMDVYAEATEESKRETVSKLSGSIKIF